MPRAVAVAVLAVLASPALADRPFDESQVITCRIDISAQDWDDIVHNRDQEEYRRCTFRYGSETYRDIGIKRRGEYGSTLEGPKPSVKLRFNDGAKFHGMRFLDLDGFWMDPSMLAERLAYKVNNQRGVQAPRYSHSRMVLSLDGAAASYLGVYGLEEIIRKDFIEDRFGRPVGNLYRMRGGEDPFVYRGDDPALYTPVPFELHTNEENPDHTALVSLIREMDTVPPSEFRARIGPLFDIDNLMDFIAIESITGEVDGFQAHWGDWDSIYSNNMYFYHKDADGKFYAIPWDREGSWYGANVGLSVFGGLHFSALTRFIVQDAAEKREFSRRCHVFLEDQLRPEVLLPQLDAMYAQIRDHVYEDVNKPYSTEEFERTYQAIREFIQRRYEVVGGELKRAFASDEVAVGLGPRGAGLLASFRANDGPQGAVEFATDPWDAYNRASGECHPARGDVDGDGFDETVVGFGTRGQGRLAVFDDPDHGGGLLAWVAVPDAPFARTNGATWPSCGDVDGDGRAEIAVGLGRGGGGKFFVFDDAQAGFALLGAVPVPVPATYNRWCGETRVALGDIDGDGRAEAVVGLGPRGGGNWYSFDDLTAGMGLLSSNVLPWPDYNRRGAGASRPACGDVDGDGRAEIVFGLEAGSAGWMMVVDDAVAGHARMESYQAGDRLTRTVRAQTRPAMADLDGDGVADLVVGFGPGSGGRVEVARRSVADGRFVPWFARRVVPANRRIRPSGETWPAAGHGKWVR